MLRYLIFCIFFLPTHTHTHTHTDVELNVEAVRSGRDQMCNEIKEHSQMMMQNVDAQMREKLAQLVDRKNSLTKQVCAFPKTKKKKK